MSDTCQELTVSTGALPKLVLRLPDGARVSGTVRLPGGEPCTGREVWQHRTYGGGVTDKSGSFELGFVPPGMTEIWLSCGTGSLVVDRLEVPSNGRVQREIQLTGTGTLVAKAPEDPMFLSGSITLVRKRDGKRVAKWISGGQLRMPFLDAGQYELQGESIVTTTVTIRASKETNVGTLPRTYASYRNPEAVRPAAESQRRVGGSR